jgi:hypothetical protein
MQNLDKVETSFSEWRKYLICVNRGFPPSFLHIYPHIFFKIQHYRVNEKDFMLVEAFLHLFIHDGKLLQVGHNVK